MKEILSSNQPLTQEVIDRLSDLGFSPDSLREAIADHNGSDNTSGNPCLFRGIHDQEALDAYLDWCDDDDFTNFEERYMGQMGQRGGPRPQPRRQLLRPRPPHGQPRKLLRSRSLAYGFNRLRSAEGSSKLGSLHSLARLFARYLFMSDYAHYDGHVFRER